jgi:hypothetical protein
MNNKSINLLALAVICGASMIGWAIAPDLPRGNVLSCVAGVTGVGFVLYWALSVEKR